MKKNFLLYFVRVTRGKGITKRKTPEWTLRKDSNHSFAELLGIVGFSGRWRQFVFCPETNMIWSADCLDFIKSFLEKQNKRWREKNKKKAMK